MPRVPTEFIDEVRAGTDIVSVISPYVPLKPTGKNFTGLCPFHKEKTASFNVSPERQIFHCFGCGQGGDAFKFLMLYEKMSFLEAVEYLASAAGLSLPSRRSAGSSRADDDRRNLARLHELAATFYQEQLAKNPAGRLASNYLQERGLTQETIRDLGFGYAPDSWNALLEYASRQNYPPESLARAGLAALRKSGRGYYDRFRNRLIIPIHNESGKVVAFGGRLLGPGEPKYLNSPETPLYSKSRTLYGFHIARTAIREEGRVILMEGYLDCIQAYQAGIRNAVASCGTSLTEAHARLMARHTDHVVINFDQDRAGEAATQRALQLLIPEGTRVSVLRLPEGDDPDSFIRKHGSDAYRERLDSANPFFDFLLRQAARRYDVNEPRGKADFVNSILESLSLVPNQVERIAYVSRLAERAQIVDATVVEELRRKLSTRTRPGLSRSEIAPPEANRELKPAERDLVRWLMKTPDAADVLADLDEQDLAALATASILKTMKNMGSTELSADAIMGRLSSDGERNLFTSILLEPAPLSRRQNARDCLNRLREQRMRLELSGLRAKVTSGADEIDRETLAAKIQSLARQIEALG